MARVHRTAASQFARDLVNIQQSIIEEGVENVGKRTPSDPIETGCCGKSPSDYRESVQLTFSFLLWSLLLIMLIKFGRIQ